MLNPIALKIGLMMSEAVYFN